MHGLIVVNKPLRKSSMAVVARVRRAATLGMQQLAEQQGQPWVKKRIKCGHAGTLDPLATGVLVCGIGQATRYMAHWMGAVKVYETTVDLSAFTDTDDIEAPRQQVLVTTPPTLEQIAEALQRMTGHVMQRPPKFSALHINGWRAYDLARKGQEVELPPRAVRIDDIEVLRYGWPTLSLRITCGKGVYIRSIARELGERLKTGGYLTQLCRTAVGPFTLGQAHPLERFNHPLFPNDLLPITLLSPTQAGAEQSAAPDHADL
jgi:tRNA pseudouridine55 synthase